jgi:predicted heme/steroid binding protein
MKRGEQCQVDEFELRRIIYDYIKEISHFSQMQVFSTSSYQRNYFQLQIDEAINGLINFLLEREEMALQQNNLAHQIEIMQQEEQAALQEAQENQTGETEPPRIITLEELAAADGSGGKKAYVAVNGNVYDVSLASRWGGGTHFGLYAGHDLTNEFIACHNAMFEILRILPIIGVLQK